MCAATFGNLRNELASVSIAVETALPVTGHLIITALMGDALRICSHPCPKTMELQDHDRLTTNFGPVGNFYVISIPPEPIPPPDVNAACILAGRLPPYPPNSRLAKRPSVNRLRVFFCAFFSPPGGPSKRGGSSVEFRPALITFPSAAKNRRFL